MKLFRKILIANRGEIAVRIIRAAQSLGIQTVAVYAEADRDAPHVSLADEAYELSGKGLGDTYLSIDRIIATALCSYCEAIHPGYGFLSENPEFVRACEEAGLVFIGPSRKVIALMGNKVAARDFVSSSGVPVIEGYTITSKSGSANLPPALKGPFLVKPAAGGGGKGMRIVHKQKDLPRAIEEASREAESYFGDGSVYIEKYLEQPRHIEVQVMGDNHGNVIHLFERECTIQRRYQKIIEEAPSPTLSEARRQSICSAALKIAGETSYNSAGTIEFLVDENQQFYFLEMNTRIQVEHPVTEMITGIDLVREQILVAAGNPLTFSQEQVSIDGHAIETRIYAEDPENQFMPSPGKMLLYREPSGDQIRIDSGLSAEARIHSFYDPLIAKLIVHRKDRQQALQTMEYALNRYIIHGIKHNVGYLLGLIRHPDFVNNRVSTSFCNDQTLFILDKRREQKTNVPAYVPLFSYVLFSMHGTRYARKPGPHSAMSWYQAGYWRHYMKLPLELEGQRHDIIIHSMHGDYYSVSMDNVKADVWLLHQEDQEIVLRINQNNYKSYISEDTSKRAFVSYAGFLFEVRRLDFLPSKTYGEKVTDADTEGFTAVRAPMSGRIVKLYVKKGEKVRRGLPLVVMEAMKMENSITSPVDAEIHTVHVSEGDIVEGNQLLISFEP